MRERVDRDRLFELTRALARETRSPTQVFLVGGSSAVVEGWRATTNDVDLRIEPENDEILRALPRLKNTLRLNVELASPADFLPEVPGWRERSPFVEQSGALTIRHYDFVSQALAKVERAHEHDLVDVRAMLERGLVTPAALRRGFEAIAESLYRFPAVDAAGFRRRLENLLG